MVLFVDLVGFSIIFPLFGHMLEYYTTHDQGLLGWAMGIVDSWFPMGEKWQRAALFGGLIGACYSGLQFLAAPFWGRLSDRIGRRPVLLISCAGNTLAYLIWIFADDFTVLLVSRLLAGAMTGNVSAANAAVADISTPQTRARGMGILGMAFGLGFILGPAIGGLSYGGWPRSAQMSSQLRRWSLSRWALGTCCGSLFASAKPCPQNDAAALMKVVAAPILWRFCDHVSVPELPR
jgi:MFS family permease